MLRIYVLSSFKFFLIDIFFICFAGKIARRQDRMLKVPAAKMKAKKVTKSRVFYMQPAPGSNSRASSRLQRVPSLLFQLWSSRPQSCNFVSNTPFLLPLLTLMLEF